VGKACKCRYVIRHNGTEHKIYVIKSVRFFNCYAKHRHAECRETKRLIVQCHCARSLPIEVLPSSLDRKYWTSMKNLIKDTHSSLTDCNDRGEEICLITLTPY